MAIVGSTVLIVEDDVFQRLVLVEWMEEAGCTVLSAGEADSALAALREPNEIRLVITDVNMPGTMDGWALAGLIRQLWPHIGVLITSGRIRPRNEDLPDGAAFLPKPFRPEELMKTADDLTSGRNSSFR